MLLTYGVVFTGWSGPIRVIAVGVLTYAGLIAPLRATGERTLSKMNGFDLVVTVALGSTLATVLLNRDVPRVEGLVALCLLVLLQYAITWGSVRSATLRGLVKSEPTLLVRDGVCLAEAMRRSG